MKEIKGNKFLTIEGASGEIYDIDYNRGGTVEVDIHNLSDGDLYVGASENFTSVDGVAHYTTIKSGGFYNGLSILGHLYIKSNGSGSIAIVNYA